MSENDNQPGRDSIIRDYHDAKARAVNAETRVRKLESILQGCGRYAMRINGKSSSFDVTNAHAIVRLSEGFPGELSGSEAIYGFVAWLSTQEATPPLGAGHDCAPWPSLIEKFCETNHLGEPRENWPGYLTHPESLT